MVVRIVESNDSRVKLITSLTRKIDAIKTKIDYAKEDIATDIKDAINAFGGADEKSSDFNKKLTTLALSIDDVKKNLERVNELIDEVESAISNYDED